MADTRQAADYLAPQPSKRSDLSLCVTLLSLFDFGAQGQVTRADWERGLLRASGEQKGDDGG